MQDSISFVPTMGALHAGHLELIRRARELSATVLVSIFVNPLQFESAEDFSKYPSDLAGDTAKALAAGATEIWAPTYDEVYPHQIVKVSAGPLGEIFEGRHRVGHFDGMLTIVSRLFDYVKPNYAIFGEKDFQQLSIIKKWVKENGLAIDIVAVPTVRDSDGLALSSRNIQLTPEGRRSALIISRALHGRSREEMHRILATEPNFEVDYAEIIDEETFELALPETKSPRGIIAGWINGVRLIDNMRMGSDL